MAKTTVSDTAHSIAATATAMSNEDDLTFAAELDNRRSNKAPASH